MHENDLIQRLIQHTVASLRAQGDGAEGRVAQIIVKAGALEMRGEAAFRNTFEHALKETPLKGAALTLIVEPATLRCPACGCEEGCSAHTIDMDSPFPVVECPQCREPAAVTGGRGIEVSRVVLHADATA